MDPIAGPKLIRFNDHAYVKLEIAFTWSTHGVDVHFNVGLMAPITNEATEYCVWNAETQPEINRKPEEETELLSSVLNGLLTDRYIDLDQGLLESIGVFSTRIYVSFNDRLGDSAVKSNEIETREEIRAIIEKAVAELKV